jgi:hypothetical protein
LLTAAQRKRLDEVVTELDALRDELQDKFDDRSERWQESEVGQELQAAINALDGAAEDIRYLGADE